MPNGGPTAVSCAAEEGGPLCAAQSQWASLSGSEAQYMQLCARSGAAERVQGEEAVIHARICRAQEPLTP
jgi:hypothetical protein